VSINSGKFIPALHQDDPALAAACRELEPAIVKDFRTAVRVFEVPWPTGGGTISRERSTSPANSETVAP
jgi:hypothetical protein